MTEKTVSTSKASNTPDQIQKTPPYLWGQRDRIGKHARHETGRRASFFVKQESIELSSNLKFLFVHILESFKTLP